jgi:hypothetical protein
MSVRLGVRSAFIIALVLVAGESQLSAAQNPWQPTAGHTQIPLWPGGAPHARPVDGPEVAATVVDRTGTKKLVGRRPWIYVDRVTQPTMTVYSPEARTSGAAIVVFPGGGYNVLAIDLEGTEACDWLTWQAPKTTGLES